MHRLVAQLGVQLAYVGERHLLRDPAPYHCPVVPTELEGTSLWKYAEELAVNRDVLFLQSREARICLQGLSLTARAS